MAKGQTLLLGIALIALVALVAAAPPMDKESIDKRDEAAAKMKARARTGPYPTPEEKERRKKGRMTPDDMQNRKKSSAIFAAVIEPKTIKDVTFPLSDEDELKFQSAREGLMEYAASKAKEHDLNDADTKKKLREATKSNQEKTRQLLVAAVKAGKSLQQSRTGLIIAQFEALSETEQKEAIAKTKERIEKMPAGARDKAKNRQQEKHKEELAQIQSLKTDAERETWLNRHYQPQMGKVPKMLE